MKETLTRQEVSQMLPAYVLGALEEHQMLACQSYLQNMADRTLLLQYRDAEEMVATQLRCTLAQRPLPAWVKEQLMARVQKNLTHRQTHHQWSIRPRTRRFSSRRNGWSKVIY